MGVELVEKSNWERKLAAYALAGGAAMLGATDASAATIVFSNQNVEIGKDEQFDLDLNLDNTIDFSFQHFFIDDLGQKNQDQRVLQMLVGPNNAYASPTTGAILLDAGTEIGPTLPKGAGEWNGNNPARLATVGGTQKGPNWAGQSAYLGLRFVIGNELHYGWAELSVSTSQDVVCDGPTGTMACASTATLKGWGYNDVAGESIVAGADAVPEPASLSLLAMGAAALGAVRARRRRQQADRA